MYLHMIARDLVRNRSTTVVLVVLMMLAVVLVADRRQQPHPGVDLDQRHAEVTQWLLEHQA